MPLQNRVAPDGSLHANEMRGMFTGNRGIIHDPQTRQLSGRQWTTRSWLVCSCQWKDWKRKVWGLNYKNRAGEMRPGWSELFFLDETTALAAGHRPCFTCRKQAATKFRHACEPVETLKALDGQLHLERRLSSKTGAQGLSAIDLSGLPDGTIVEAGGSFFAIKEGRALKWSFAGYALPIDLGELVKYPVSLVTPKLTVNALRAGFKPAWHASAA